MTTRPIVLPKPTIPMRPRPMARTSNRKVCSKAAKANRGRTTRCGCISRRWARFRCSRGKEEIRLARKIEITRAAFRRKLLCCDYVIRSAVKVLHRVHRGELPFDRTVQVSVTDRLEKDQILGRLPHNLATLDRLLERNARRLPRRHRASRTSRPSARRPGSGSSRRRCRAVLLVEELGLRTQRIEPMIGQLEQFSRRIDQLRSQIEQMKRDKKPAARAQAAADRDTATSCGHCRKRRRACGTASRT